METKSHSFIVKIWLKGTVAEDGQVTWRGHITHVPSKERMYFEDLKTISQFILPYLTKAGVAQEPYSHPFEWNAIQSLGKAGVISLNFLKLKWQARRWLSVLLSFLNK